MGQTFCPFKVTSSCGCSLPHVPGYFPTESLRLSPGHIDAGGIKDLVSISPPAPLLPSQPTTWQSRSKMSTLCGWHACRPQVLDQKGSPKRPQIQSQEGQVMIFSDCWDPQVSLVHPCFETEVLHVLIAQGLLRTICGQFLSLMAPGSADWGIMVSVWLGKQTSAPSIPSTHEICLSVQVKPWLARKFRFITPDLFPPWHSPMLFEIPGLH